MAMVTVLTMGLMMVIMMVTVLTMGLMMVIMMVMALDNKVFYNSYFFFMFHYVLLNVPLLFFAIYLLCQSGPMAN